MHIVITRPKEDSLYLIENLIKLGHVVTHLPVIKIEKLETKKINLLNYQAIIFTSSNAIRFMNIEKFNSKIKCFCVGRSTELTAKQVGFSVSHPKPLAHKSLRSNQARPHRAPFSQAVIAAQKLTILGV